jgi:hypothetical protein
MPAKLFHKLTLFLRVLWAAPCTLLGAVLAAPVLLTGGSAKRVGRAVEISIYPAKCPAGTVLRHLPFSAITLGHIIIAISGDEMARLRAHEHAHVRQYERLGPFFLLAYPACSLAATLRGQSPHKHNRLERQAISEAASIAEAAQACRNGTDRSI